MKTIKISLALTLVAIIFGTSTPALAAPNSGNQSNRRSPVAAERSAQPNPKAANKDFNARVKEAKSKLNKKLTPNEQTRIKNRCQAAQNALGAYEKKVDNYETSRKHVYGNIIERLGNLSAKLPAVGLQEGAVAVTDMTMQLETKAGEVYSEIDNLQKMISDLRSVNCVEDPESFQALLDLSREQRNIIKDKTTEVRRYFSEEIVKELSDVKQKLSELKSVDGESEE